MQAILRDLDEEDYFALIEFDHTISSWRESLSKATMENVAEALVYVGKIQEMGG